jgi:cytochrome c553
MKNLVIPFLAAALSIASFGALAGDPVAGKAKSMTCAGCHGKNGISSNGMWPNLAGQKEAYLVSQMQMFKDGRRQNAMMSAMAKGLSDADIANLAAYYAALK